LIGPAGASESLLEALTSCGIPYVIGGSVASGAHGAPRATLDVDIVADLTPEKIRKLAELLGKDFYLDAEAAIEAIQRGRPFNVISMRDVVKFDFFPAGSDPLGPSQLARSLLVKIDLLSTRPVPIASPEDVILAKLRWYDQGGRTSERQFNDILGVIKVKEPDIDWVYIRDWAAKLGISDLLERLPCS
jgi:hypothetical protein